MMHSACIAAFRTQARRRHLQPRGVSPKPVASATPKLMALVEQEIHQCVQRRAAEAAVPAYYTLCGYLVPPANVEKTCARVTCPQCLRCAGERTDPATVMA